MAGVWLDRTARLVFAYQPRYGRWQSGNRDLNKVYFRAPGPSETAPQWIAANEAESAVYRSEERAANAKSFSITYGQAVHEFAWYESEDDIPTWMLGGRWSFDGIAKTTAFADNAEYARWGGDRYYIQWNKASNTWSGLRNGRTMRGISTNLPNARQFDYTAGGSAYTAVWSAT